MELIGYVAAIFMGLSLGLLGGGGSILTVPILMYFFGEGVSAATTGSLFVVGMTSFLGAILSYRRGLVDIKTGLSFAVPGAIGILLVRRFALPFLPDEILFYDGWRFSKSALILFSFVFLMIYAARAMLKSPSNSYKNTGGQFNFSPGGIAFRGFCVGAVTAFVGAGGGFLIVPALVLFLGMPMSTAVGTSLAIVAVNALFGFIISVNDHVLNWRVLLMIVALSLIGLICGHKVSVDVPERALKRSFGYFILFVGFFVFIDQVVKLAAM